MRGSSTKDEDKEFDDHAETESDENSPQVSNKRVPSMLCLY